MKELNVVQMEKINGGLDFFCALGAFEFGFEMGGLLGGLVGATIGGAIGGIVGGLGC